MVKIRRKREGEGEREERKGEGGWRGERGVGDEG